MDPQTADNSVTERLMSKSSGSVIRRDVTPFDEEETRKIVDQFNRDGYYFLENVFTEEEVRTLRSAMDKKWEDPRIQADEAGDHIRGISMMRMYEYDTVFRDVVVREPIVSIAEAILGHDCHLMSQNCLRYEPGQGGGWHADDRIHFPLPDSVSRHNPEITIPCFVLNVLFPLSQAGCDRVRCYTGHPRKSLLRAQPQRSRKPDIRRPRTRFPVRQTRGRLHVPQSGLAQGLT